MLIFSIPQALLVKCLKQLELLEETAAKKQSENFERAMRPFMNNQTEFSVIDYDTLAFKISSR